MPQTALSNLGLNAFYDAAEDGWKGGVDFNWALLDALLLGGITVDPKSVSAQPVSPAEGSVYIIGSSPTGTQWGARSEGDIAVFNTNNPTNAGWAFTTPREGWQLWDRVNNRWIFYDGVEWIPRGAPVAERITINDTGGDFQPDVETHANSIMVFSAAFDDANDAINIPNNGTQGFPIGTRLRFRNEGSGDISFTDAGLVTWNGEDLTTFVLPPNDSEIEIEKIDTNEWTITDINIRGVFNTDVNGFTTTVNIDIDYSRKGDIIEIEPDSIQGTSNATSKVTATALPQFLRGATGKRAFVRVKDNGAANFSIANANIATSGIITFYPDLNSANSWTASGQATIAGFNWGYSRAN